MFRLSLTGVILLALPGISAGQTHDQCAALAKGVMPVVSSFSALDAGLNSLDWNHIIIFSDGAVKTSAVAAQKAQATLAPAVRAYLTAVQDFTYQLQICAR